MNPEAEALTGWLQAEVLGKDAREVLRLDDPWLAGDQRRDAEAERGRRDAVGSSDGAWLIARDGSRIPIEYNAAPLRDDRGQAFGLVLVFRDITERMEAEAEKARLYRELQHHAEELEAALAERHKLDRLKNEFMQNVSHELRTPLTLVRGYAELLVDGDCGALTADQQEMMDRLKRQAIRLSDLVGDISLSLAAQARPLTREAVAVDELLLAAMAKQEAPVREAKLTLAAQIPPDLPPVMGAPDTLARMFDNLLTNAVKFTPEGGRIDLRAQQRNGDLVVEVSDTGIGIAAEEQARIFDRFYQVDGASTRRYGGMGLGLALVKEIAEAHAGAVSVDSELGVGSTFRVRLPAGE
jgi:PAS domain S-box-containing protein